MVKLTMISKKKPQRTQRSQRKRGYTTIFPVLLLFSSAFSVISVVYYSSLFLDKK
jgi:hypothetical protein